MVQTIYCDGAINGIVWESKKNTKQTHTKLSNHETSGNEFEFQLQLSFINDLPGFTERNIGEQENHSFVSNGTTLTRLQGRESIMVMAMVMVMVIVMVMETGMMAGMRMVYTLPNGNVPLNKGSRHFFSGFGRIFTAGKYIGEIHCVLL